MNRGSDDTYRQVPQDSADRRKIFQETALRDIGGARERMDEDMEAGRYEIIPSNAIKENYLSDLAKKKKKKKLTPGGAGAEEDEDEASPYGKERMTGDNYQHMYMEEKAHEREERALHEAAQKLTRLGTAQSRVQDIRRDDEMRHRVRKLREDMDWWQSQTGQGMYDDDVIGSSVKDLQQQLDALPDDYK